MKKRKKKGQRLIRSNSIKKRAKTSNTGKVREGSYSIFNKVITFHTPFSTELSQLQGIIEEGNRLKKNEGLAAITLKIPYEKRRGKKVFKSMTTITMRRKDDGKKRRS